MTKSLILAGGCFWCVEHDLREAPGVISVTSGYSGGESDNPSYENHSGHREVVVVEYDDEKIEQFKTLIDSVWQRIQSLNFELETEYDETFKGIISFEEDLLQNR